MQHTQRKEQRGVEVSAYKVHHPYFTNSFFRYENIASRQVSVNERLSCEVAHAMSDVATVPQQSWRQFTVSALTGSGGKMKTTWCHVTITGQAAARTICIQCSNYRRWPQLHFSLWDEMIPQVTFQQQLNDHHQLYNTEWRPLPS